ncbi:MAG: class I tRNA ligase family protein, partial [Candidatus Micrarchaeaceae archaeon]
ALSNIEIMKKEMKRLGASFDERYEYKTLEGSYRAKVQLSLLEMYRKGFVYRAMHPVEWCPRCESSIAREETIENEEKATLNYIDFDLASGRGKLTIATTRPELLHACVAIAVNPADKKHKKFIGKEAVVPIFGNKVKIIGDESIKMDFGTGAEMVCTFGDKNDVIMYYKHNLRLVDAMDSKGVMKNAGELTGLTAAEARGKVLEMLKKEGRLGKQEQISHSYKVHDRCKSRIELRSEMQWFLKTKEYAGKIKEMAHEMRWTPDTLRQRLDDWVDYIEWDWNISRNRVFGTPIPFWYCEDCGEIIPPDESKLPVNPALDKAPVDKCPKCGGRIVGETDTCDVWVDSSITPLVISGWPDKSSIGRLPVSVRIQGEDIIRTWLFYTTYRVWALVGNKPFENLIATGMILGTDGKEMHKSEGNGVGVDELLEKYPLDAVRLWVALSGNVGKDKQFSYKEVDYAKNFLNKLYNTAIFVKGAVDRISLPKEEPKEHMGVFDIWILHRLNSVIKGVEVAYDSFNLYEAMSRLINFYWHEFADYYIEDVKYRIYSEDKRLSGSAKAAAYTLNKVLMDSITLFAPVMPYIAEEINSWFGRGSVFEGPLPKPFEKPETRDYVINGLLFEEGFVEVDYENMGAFINSIIAEVRKKKSEAHMALNVPIPIININVPVAYYKAVNATKEEIKEICKAQEVKIEKSDNFSVSISLKS